MHARMEVLEKGYEAASKEEYPHYLIKEIMEQPLSIERCLAGRLQVDSGEAVLGGLNLTADEVVALRNVITVGCGTGYHASMIAAMAVESIARLPARAELAVDLAGALRPVSQWVTVNGLLMHSRASRGRAAADAPTVVLIHGLGMSSRYMEPLLDELGPHARVVAPDLPGYGRSASPGHLLNLADMADTVDAWMEAMGIESAVVAGNSLGAQVISQLGVRHPDRLTSAVLIGPTRDPSSGGPFEHTMRLALDIVFERPALIVVGFRDYLRAGPRLMFRLFAQALRQPEENYLQHLRVPTLIVRGSRDPIASQSWVETVRRLVPTSRLVVIPGAAHAVNFSSAPALAEQILAFLADEEPAN